MTGRSLLSFVPAGLLLFGTGCISDPAVRLAGCLKHGAKQLAKRSESAHVETCRLGIAGRYSVVLHPDRRLSEDELVAAGLPVEVVGTLRSIHAQGPQGATIYVIPEKGHSFPSSTTSQKHWVSLPKVLMHRTDGSHVELVLRRTERGIEVIEIR